MSKAKTPKALLLIAILALAGALVVAGCGGSGGTTTSGQGASEEGSAEAGGATAGEEAEEGAAEEPEEEATESQEEGESEGGAAAEGGAEAAEGESEAEEGEAAANAEGMTIFTTNCGSCHTLKEAGTSGTVGPNLDELEPELATVEHQVQNGGGPMPAFGNEGILSPAEVKAVATYVSSVAGTE